MSCKRVHDIKPQEKAEPIEIRVLKKWKPKGRKEYICYQFVDIYGDGIEATAELKYEEYFDSIVELNSCYKISGYICTIPRTYMATLDHEESLVIGQKAKFMPIPDFHIPTVCFNFATYDMLGSRIKNTRLLTDYIGRVEKNSLRSTNTGKTLRKIMLQDEMKNQIEITLWPEMQHLIGDEVKSGDIVAITSTMVTEYNGVLQLESTYLTTALINPNMPQTVDHVIRLKELPAMDFKKINEKIVSILDLSATNLRQTQGYPNFACLAKIKEINVDRGWFYVLCSKCSNKLYPELEDGLLKYVCKDDDNIEPKFMYCVNATIADGTGGVDVVFFNDGMFAMVNMSCEDMVAKYVKANPKKLPQPITSTINKSKLLHLTVKNDGKIVVNDATETVSAHSTAAKPSSSKRQYLHALDAGEDIKARKT